MSKKRYIAKEARGITKQDLTKDKGWECQGDRYVVQTASWLIALPYNQYWVLRDLQNAGGREEYAVLFHSVLGYLWCDENEAQKQLFELNGMRLHGGVFPKDEFSLEDIHKAEKIIEDLS